MTVKEIAEEHDVSRVSIHTYRRRGVFPQPVEGEGTTRLRFRADEVAAFFAANPKQPGKRTDVLAKKQQQGDPVSTTVDPRLALMSALNDPPYNEVAGKRGTPLGEAAQLLADYRAAVLREAANGLVALGPEDSLVSGVAAWNEAVDVLRRMADQTPQGEGA
jgi:hypothetical protein